MPPTKRDSIEQVKLDGARVTMSRIKAEIAENPELVTLWPGLNPASKAPAEDSEEAPVNSKKEGK